MVTCSASGENQARALGADAITQEEQTVKGLRRDPCAPPTLKRTEEMTEEGRGTQQPPILRKEVGAGLGIQRKECQQGSPQENWDWQAVRTSLSKSLPTTP